MESHSSMEQQFLKKLIDVIDANLHDEQFGVTELAEQLGMSRYTLHRKVKLIVKKSVSEFIRDERLKRAYELLQKKTGTVSEIAFSVGFGSVSYFNRCFNEHYGYPPGEVLKGLHQPKEPVQKDSKRTLLKKLQSKKVLYAISVLILLTVAIVLLIQTFQRSNIEKTIAVLPPKDKSPSQSECVLLEGVREDLQSKLFSIAGLDVVSGTTTDTYRNSEKSLKEIAKELNVNFVVELRGQTISGNSTVWVQLIKTSTDKPIWSGSYEEELNDEKIQELIKDIVLVIADKLDVPVTQEEKNNIEKIQTNSVAAYRYYSLGVNLLKNYEISGEMDDCIEAKKYFENAIDLDSTFADAYCQLAAIYIAHLTDYYLFGKLYNLYLDSGLVMIKNAVKYELSDPHKALRLEADYYSRKGMPDKAIKKFEQIWKNKTKDYNYYYEKAGLFMYGRDYYNFFENCIRYLNLKPKNVVADENKYLWLIDNLAIVGFPDLAQKYNDELVQLSKDSAQFLFQLSRIYCYSERFDKALDIMHNLYQSDTTNLDYLDWIWFTNYYKRDFEESFKYAQLLEQKVTEQYENALVGSLYLQRGMEKEAQKHINGAFKMAMNAIDLNVAGAQDKSFYGLISGIYAMRGEKKKALENLRIFASEATERLAIIQLTNFLMSDNIREEPEFKEIMKEIEVKYQKGHKELEELFIREGILEH